MKVVAQIPCTTVTYRNIVFVTSKPRLLTSKKPWLNTMTIVEYYKMGGRMVQW